jgi:predicted transcriptional regulator
MRLAGATEYEIAKQLGVSQPAVSKMLTQARVDITEQVALDQDEYKRIQRTDIFAALAVVRNKLTSKDAGEQLAAIDRLNRLHERLAKLEGLDAPEKKEIKVTPNIIGIIEHDDGETA